MGGLSRWDNGIHRNRGLRKLRLSDALERAVIVVTVRSTTQEGLEMNEPPKTRRKREVKAKNPVRVERRKRRTHLIVTLNGPYKVEVDVPLTGKHSYEVAFAFMKHAP